MDTVNSTGNTPELQDDSKLRVRIVSDAPGDPSNMTPASISSSPPSRPSQTSANVETTSDQSPPGAKSDSEAETVLLPGINGYSPSKSRKQIKLEDDGNDGSDMDEEKKNGERKGASDYEGATSTLGKRKRSKHGKNDHARTGNSSGLSSVPTSPVAAKPNPSDSDNSRSPSPPRRHRKAKSLDRNSIPPNEARSTVSNGEQEHHRVHRQRSTGLESTTSPHKRSKESRQLSHVGDNSHPRTRSASPLSEDYQRRASTQLLGSASQDHSQKKKKKIPAPLRPTRERQSVDAESEEDSSHGESPYPRRSRTRNLATPPTGDSSVSQAKMVKKRRYQYGLSALAIACEHGGVAKCREELAEAPDDLDNPDNDGNTPLQTAALNGHEDVCKLLIDAGCNIHCVNHKKDSPLLDAVENGHLGVVRVLLAAGVNPRARNLRGEEPLSKINEEDDNAERIRQALLAARPMAPPQQTTPLQHPSLLSESSNPLPRGLPRTSAGRQTQTRKGQLFLQFDIPTLRQFAAIGDVGTVQTIIDTIGMNGLDDPESVVAAARGGHYEVLTLLLALAHMNPDPDPLRRQDPEYATPMLAAIGGDNIKIIELLLANVSEGRLDPARKHNNKHYHEIARERVGPYWQEEERMLKDALDNARSSTRDTKPNGSPRTYQKKQSDSGDRERSNGIKSKQQSTSSLAHNSKHAQRSPSTADVVVIKRGPGRPRKEEHGRSPTSDQDALSKHNKTLRKPDLDTTTEAEPTKPRRKLVSGRDLKGERDRLAGEATIKPSKSSLERTIVSDFVGSANDRNGSRSSDKTNESESASERFLDRARSIRRDDSKDRVSVIRGDSPAKRQRSSSTPPSEARDPLARDPESVLSVKRRRLESEEHSRAANSSEARSSSSPDQKGSSHLHAHTNGRLKKRENPHKDQDSRRTKLSSIADSNSSHDPRRNENAKKSSSGRAADGGHSSKDPSPSLVDSIHTEREQKANLAKEAADTEARVKREAQEVETQRLDEIRRREETEQRRLNEEAARQEQAELAKREEAEAARKEQQEAQVAQEKLKREEAEAQAKAEAEEEHNRLQIEQQRLQREEQERQRAARIAEQRMERLRALQEQEDMRLAKLPALLRWLDRYSQPYTADVASMFRCLYGYRYDTIRPEATGTPDAKEQWILNTQVALLLGEKDLQLSRYTGWERIQASESAKWQVWGKLVNDMIMIGSLLRPIASDEYARVPGVCNMQKMRNEAFPLFQAMDLFFVKLSDFMFIVPTYPHLQNIEMPVAYVELPPEGSPLSIMTHQTWKWKIDPDAGSRHGFAPLTKYYLNGQFLKEDQLEYAKTSKTPFPQKLVPRFNGIFECPPGHPEYIRLCKAQGLSHLVNGQSNQASPSGNGVTPPASNTSEDVRRVSGASSEQSVPLNGFTNGVNGIK